MRLLSTPVLRVAFAGSPAFALAVPEAIYNSRHTLVACWTQPERPAGRGLKKQSSAIRRWAEHNGVDIYQPSVWDDSQQRLLSDLQLDVLLVMAYGLMLPEDALKCTRLGCFGLHLSLLPRWRGAAPVARAIEAGDQRTGLTLMRMTACLDAGPIIEQQAFPLCGAETTASLNETMAQVAATMSLAFLDHAETRCQQARGQKNDGACYAPKLISKESWLNWHSPAVVLARKIRAFDPWPMTRTLFNGRELLIRKVRIASSAEQRLIADRGAGHAVVTADKEILVACGHSALLIQEVQQAGKRILSSRDFINGLHGNPPMVFYDRSSASNGMRTLLRPYS